MRWCESASFSSLVVKLLSEICGFTILIKAVGDFVANGFGLSIEAISSSTKH